MSAVDRDGPSLNNAVKPVNPSAYLFSRLHQDVSECFIEVAQLSCISPRNRKSNRSPIRAVPFENQQLGGFLFQACTASLFPGLSS